MSDGPAAARLAEIVRSAADFDEAVKWRQLTFALDGDFDHWICAIATTKQRMNLVFHFGSLLTDGANVLAGEGKYVRKMTFGADDDLDADVIGDLLRQAIDRLPEFRRLRRRGPAGPAPRSS